MAGWDKAVLAEKLIKLGWKEHAGLYLIPPDSLWQDRPFSFYVYDAEALQDLLGPKSEEIR